MELDKALQQLAGGGLYRNNIFRVTGLPVDASSRQIRYRRQEINLAVKLGTSPHASSGELPLDPAPDADAIRAAFESLHSPIVRLVHELLWLWRNAGASEHNATIRAHCAALEDEYAIDPIEPDAPEAARLDPMWKDALSAWAGLLDSEELWDWARQRVLEIDDPRLTIGTVWQLRTRLPEHIVAVSVGLAVRAADVSVWAADRHLELLSDSPFDGELVDRMVREAVRPAEERLRTACEDVGQSANADSSRAAAAGSELLASAGQPLQVAIALLGQEDPVTHALHDQVAAAVNQCAVACYNETRDTTAARSMLDSARKLARESSTIEQIDGNLTAIVAGRIRKGLDPLCTKGQVELAAAILRTMHRRTNDEHERKQLARLLADGYSLAAPLTRPPARFSLFGFGLAVYGRRAQQPDGTFISTHFVTALFIPVLPLAAYARDAQFVYAKVRLSPVALWWRRIMSMVLILCAMTWILGTVGLWIVAAMAALGLARMGVQELSAPRWVAQQASS